MMSSLWISLGLLYLLPHSVSSDAVVSLTCYEMKPVQFGATVTVNCSVKWKTKENCKVTKSSLTHSNDTTTECKNTSFSNSTSTDTAVPSGRYNCSWDNANVKLFFIAEKEDNVTVNLESNCGLDSADIHVHVFGMTATPALNMQPEKEETQSYLIFSILGVLATVIVLTILSFFIRKYKISKNNSSHSRVSQEDNCKGCHSV